MEENKPNIELISITNIESYFKRNDIIDKNYSKAKNKMSININSHVADDKFEVSLTLTLIQSYKDVVYVDIKITTIGAFNIIGKIPEDNLSQFCDINAPAIIFPFVRETVTNLSIKGGVQPIIIQPINFVELTKK